MTGQNQWLTEKLSKNSIEKSQNDSKNNVQITKAELLNSDKFENIVDDVIIVPSSLVSSIISSRFPSK